MSSFIKRLKDGLIWQRKQPDQSASSQRGELYTDLKLPLNIFIRCLVHSDLSGLVIKGNPTSEQIAIAWAGIYSQYIDLNSENETIYILELQWSIICLTSHISETETCIYFLQDTYHSGLVGILEKNGYKLHPEYTNDHLQIIQNKLARKKLELQVKIREYDSYIESHKNDEVSERYFITTLLRLAKYQGVAIIRSKDISVEEFVMLLKDYLHSIKQQQPDGD